MIITALSSLGCSKQENESIKTNEKQTLSEIFENNELNDDQIYDIYVDYLYSLQFFYEISTYNIDQVDDLSDLESTFKDNIKKAQLGVEAIKKYSNNDIEELQLASSGIMLGAEALIKGHNMVIDYLESTDPLEMDINEFDQLLTDALALNKEGFISIMISAPQIAYITYNPPEFENPTGNIYYTISKTTRNKILSKINSLFGEAIDRQQFEVELGGDYNAILIAVENLKTNLEFDTYEELNSTTNAETEVSTGASMNNEDWGAIFVKTNRENNDFGQYLTTKSCTPSKSYRCNIDGCESFDSSVMTFVGDTEPVEYATRSDISFVYRCDLNGCDNYVFIPDESGIYKIHTGAGNGAFIKIDTTTNNYMEVLSAMETTIMNYGTCFDRDYMMENYTS